MNRLSISLKGTLMKNTKNHFLAKSLLALLIFSVSQLSFANGNNNNSNNSNQQQTNGQQQKVKTFYLNLWAPDQVAPAEAKPVEYGVSYQYSYTPESHEVQSGDVAQKVAFKFHPDVGQRYQFRWISADQPQLVSFAKVKKHKMKVNVDVSDNTQDQDVYFEVWVYDTLTGEVIMCDPRIKIRK
jgi:hypothetical protein